ncbi:MAG: VanZ family protein [Lachnospiraceae bacterium]|nr:VanZ family protein [Lachnospiraceae bacterium]
MSKKKTILTRIARFLPMILIMAAIFAFSAMPGEESGNASGSIVKVVVEVVEKVSHEAVTEDRTETIHFVIRKIAHFTEFMILGMTAVLAFYNKGRKWLYNFLLPAVVSAVYAMSDEFHQMFVADRGPSVRDVCIDSTGALTGAVIILLAVHFHYVKRNSQQL